MLLSSSNYNKGECLRTLTFSEKSLDPVGNFADNKQIIRTSLFNESDNSFYTFGEEAMITLWREGAVVPAAESTNLKDESSVKKKLKKKSNPY